jgi:multidrug resistance efflux pump
MTADELTRLRAELRDARRAAHTADAERAETEALVLEARARQLRAEARADRTHAETAGLRQAIDDVRRLCTLVIEQSVRVHAIEQAQDTITLIDAALAGDKPSPGDGAWHTVWLEGKWRWITSRMTTPEREHAADAVARHDAVLAAADSDLGRGEPEGLRWWRDDA